MVTRRSLGVGALTLLSVSIGLSRQLRADELLMVRIRADETVRGVLPPIALQNLTVTPDQSATARQMASRAPRERAAPVILIIVGAIALVQIVAMSDDMS